MSIHKIRLRGPWTCEREDDREVWRRKFGRPSNLTEQERVRLVLGVSTTEVIAALNGELLGRGVTAGSAVFYDVTGVLRERNELELRIPCGVEGREREPPVEVCLEIDS